MAPLTELQGLQADQNEALELASLVDWIRFAASQMGTYQVHIGHGFDSAWDEAVFLCLRTLKLPWDTPAASLNATLLRSERQRLWHAINRRCIERIPTAYLVGEAWFCGESFIVSPEVLIPRSPIAELIQSHFEPWLEKPPNTLLDLCTGSGCIGLACALVFPEASVHLSDISASALDMAHQNRAQKHRQNQVSIHQGDLFSALPQGLSYDLIVSNPPYVDAADMADMPAEYRAEPSLGLTAGDDGLAIVHRILRSAPEYLTETGLLVCEVGNSAEALLTAYPNMPFEWPVFEQGGHGVFIISAPVLKHYWAAAERD